MRSDLASSGSQDGFSLVELLVALALLTVVLAAVLSVLEGATRSSASQRERAIGVRAAQVGIDRIVRDGRQAFAVNPSTATRLDLSVFRAGATRRVVYDCAVAHPTLAGLRQCTRQESSGTTVGPAQVVVDDVAGASVFSYAGSPTTYVTIDLDVAASGERREGHKHRIRLHDGFGVRNRGVAP